MSSTFDEIQIGQKASLSKTITETDIYAFAGITGDFNPVHVDAEFAKKTIFKERIAHGLLTAGLISAVLGTKLPGPNSIYLKQELEFTAPVRIGDTITAEVEVLEKKPEKKILRLKTIAVNQKGDTVLRGEALIKKIDS
ncbi:MAG: MaoC family dehydratase [Thermanaeromonas sp.]|uniref:MaoC family dehydratase n=1 Tax=Thermanaeromonas sp. TaxID=2003697 RepID=UPI00243D65C7|nr:MaoC family dehydratase [Thermanaeromonas sp.]MCG0278274.1 MaoC family dehydratase [Thermanaeromonas sp.]